MTDRQIIPIAQRKRELLAELQRGDGVIVAATSRDRVLLDELWRKHSGQVSRHYEHSSEPEWRYHWIEREERTDA